MKFMKKNVEKKCFSRRQIINIRFSSDENELAQFLGPLFNDGVSG